MELDLNLEYDLVEIFTKLGSIFWYRRGIQTNIVALLTFENYVRYKDTPLIIILVIIIGGQIEEKQKTGVST